MVVFKTQFRKPSTIQAMKNPKALNLGLNLRTPVLEFLTIDPVILRCKMPGRKGQDPGTEERH